VALLDPELTLSQPTRVAACTGVDALAHAVETAVTTKRTALSRTFSRQAYRLCAENLPRLFAEPNNLEVRGPMQLGAAFAGIAIENSMLGAAHAAANPLTAHYGIVHGMAVGLMLPHVVRFNGQSPEVEAVYASVLDVNRLSASASLATRIEQLLTIAGMPASLAEAGVKEDRIAQLAEEAARQWTARFNPRPVASEDFVRLYESALIARPSAI
jgi:alcohol dehydrogenase